MKKRSWDRVKFSKRYFTKNEQKQLKCNPNVKAVNEKAITYKDEFRNQRANLSILSNKFRPITARKVIISL